MKIDADALAAHLENNLRPIYIVSGDETLLVQEACTLIRDAATNSGYQERRVFNVEANFNWDEFNQVSNELSLFAAQRLIELRIPSGKPSDPGKKALQTYAEAIPGNDLLLIVTGKLDKRGMSSAWFKALETAGAQITLWPVPHHQLPRWIEQRMGQSGVNADQEAIALLADLVDGNLLAATQEIEKLKLATGDSTVTPEMVRASVSDSSHYNQFELVDTAMSGDAESTCKMLQRLKSEGQELIPLLWNVSREVRLLSKLHASIASGMSENQAMQQQRIWRSKQRVVSAALRRLNQTKIDKLIQQLARIDLTAKGAAPGNSWDQLESLLLALAGSSNRKSRPRKPGTAF